MTIIRKTVPMAVHPVEQPEKKVSRIIRKTIPTTATAPDAAPVSRIIRRTLPTSVVEKKIIKKTVKDGYRNGQKYATPDAKDAKRIFYTSLLEARPDSQMARKWCIEHGLYSLTVVDLIKSQLGQMKM